MPDVRRIATNLLLLFIGTAVALLILEIGLRVLHPFEFRVRGDQIVLPANVSYVTTNEFADKLDKTIIHSKNSLGFRGAPPPADLQNTLSIVAVGGSTTESNFQSDDKEWVFLLGEHLSRNFSPLWINNAGLDGHSTFGHQILMQDLVSKIRPKIVLFLVGINEIGRSGLIINEQKYQRQIQADSPTLLLLSVANESEVFTLAVNLFRYYKARRAGLTHDTQLDLAREAERGFEVSPADQERILSEHRQKYLPDYEQRLENLILSAEKIGSRPVFITQPALYGPVIDAVTGTDLGLMPFSNEMNGTLSWRVLELYNDVLRDTAARHGFLLIDLAARMPKSSALYYDAIHYTNRGAKVVAGIVYEGLCPWLAEQYPQYAAEKCPALAE